MAHKKHKQGFALLSAEKRKAIASLGGTTAQKSGKGYRFTSQKAKEAQAKRKTWQKKKTEIKK